MAYNDIRLIEDFLPIEVISVQASREKSVRRGHISSLHLWWARRPLAACRAAIYGMLVPSTVASSEVGLDDKLSRQLNVSKFIEGLCAYPASTDSVLKARQHIYDAQQARQSRRLDATGAGADPAAPDRRPKVLDMFAGGGSIPLEALRLGCDAIAVDLNPVAHIIELCTLYYPNIHGQPNGEEKGCSDTNSWAGLATEVRYWAGWVLKRASAEIGDLYPAPELTTVLTGSTAQPLLTPSTEKPGSGTTYIPVGYLWTRTIRCKSPSCRATVPLVRQTWLCKKRDRFAALLLRPDANKRGVEFRVVESKTEQGLGFDPAGLSKAGNAVCRVCGTVAGDDYVKAEGLAGRLGMQLMATAAVQRGTSGKAYLQASSSDGDQIQEIAARRLDALASRSGMTVPSEAIVVDGKKTCWSPLYGLTTFADLFTTRQLLCLMTFADLVKKAHHEMIDRGYEQSAATAVATYLGLMVDKLADYNSTLCLWNFTGGRGVKNSFPRPGIPVTWDFCETNPFNPFGASWVAISDDVPAAIEMCTLSSPGDAYVTRGSATQLSLDDESIDVVVTDPPYYDNVAYANVSDFFYVWLKRSIGFLHPEHFAGETTPKKAEAIADASRHEGGKQRAREAYQAMMAAAFREAHRVLKEDGQMCVVYAHKTTLGWSALVDALRSTGFVVTEAWPIETEKPGRLRDQNSASLASSIFLSTRKRERGHVGSYEQAARPELHQIVQERVSTLWALGVTGADLVIAAVGAGLRAFTSYDRVEYANGDEVSTEQFLAEVEAAVLETLLEKIFGYAGLSVGAVDGATRFYTLWRYAYGISELDAGEAIVFTYSQPVELDGPNGLSAGTRPLVGKKATKYRLLDFSERGANEKLGLSDGAGRAAPLIDILHRVLWLSENDPRHIATFLDEAQPDLEQLRVIAQALAGAGLKGGADADGGNILVTTSAEQSALSKLTAGPNWRSLTHQPTRQDLGPLFAEASSA